MSLNLVWRSFPYPLAPHPPGFRIPESHLHCEPSSPGVLAKEAILGFGVGRPAHAQYALSKGSMTAADQATAREHSHPGTFTNFKIAHVLEAQRTLIEPSDSEMDDSDETARFLITQDVAELAAL